MFGGEIVFLLIWVLGGAGILGMLGGATFGLGWMLRAEKDSSASDEFHPESYGHTGFTGTSLWVDPAQKLVVACLTNSVYPGRAKTGTHEFRQALHAMLARALRS